MEITPTDLKRICIPVHGHIGSQEERYTSWDGSEQSTVGVKIYNENDSAYQVASAVDGVIICAEGKAPDGRDRSVVIQEYLDKHPFATKTKSGIEKLAQFMNEVTKEWREKKNPETGKVEKQLLGDVYTTDLNFVSKKIAGAPAKDDIKPGQMIVGQKVQSVLQAIRIGEGVEFEGAPGTSGQNKGHQTARAGGAYLVAEMIDGQKHVRLVQKEDFDKAYTIIKMPKAMAKEKVKE